MRKSFAVEQVIDASTSLHSLPRHVPPQLWEYAQAFLKVGRHSVRFVWRDEKRWLDVYLVRKESASRSSNQRVRVSARITETEIPRGVTVRELDVLTLVALGLTNLEIASRLGTSSRTVSTQIEKLLTKLEQGTRGGLAALAVDSGLLRMPLPGGPPASGGIGVAELELTYQQVLDRFQAPIRVAQSERAPIRLGVLTPGDLGGDSEQLLLGMKLAVEELNHSGGVLGRMIEPVEVVVEMFDWSSVNAGLTALFDLEVDAIVTSYVSAEHSEFLERVADYGRPFLHTATFDADVVRTHKDPQKYLGVFQMCASEVHYGPGMLRFVNQLEKAGLWKPQRRAIVSVEQTSESMHLTTERFYHAAREQGWSVEQIVSTPTGMTDWKETIEQIALSAPDVLFVSNYIETEMAAFQEALLERPLPALVYGIYAPSIPSFIERLGAAAEGIVWATTTGTYDDELGRRFRTSFTKRFGFEPGWSQAGAAYDQVRLLSAAWASVEAQDVADVVRYIRRWPYRGVNGVYYFGDSSHVPQLYPDTTNDAALSQAHLVYQIQDGKHVLLGPEPFGSITSFRRPPWM
jgi:branched-chain amino acid transport system substrate-binding protein